jgi:hypothetical protein
MFWAFIIFRRGVKKHYMGKADFINTVTPRYKKVVLETKYLNHT